MERVHTVWDYHDGPRTGIADYQGSPHYFACAWDDVSDEYGDSYRLTPIDTETLAFAIEEWNLWRRWELAFHTGKVDSDSHPGLGGRDARYDELRELIQSRLAALPPPRIHVLARFQSDFVGEELPVGVMRPFLVTWSDVE